MADNITLNSGSGGAVLATDDISSVHYQIVKLAHGALDSATIVSTSSGLPVDLRTDNLSGNLDVNIAASGATVTVDLGANNDVTVTSGTVTLGANSGVDIGDVDVTSVVPGTGASNLGKTEDAAHTTGDVGVMALSVRRDADTSPVSTDGDYAPLVTNATGYLKVEVFDGGESHTVDGTVTANAGSGTFTVTDDGSFTLAANSGVDIGDVDVTSVVPGTGATNLGKAEDAAHSSGDVGVMALVVRRDADTTLVATDGDYAPLQVNSAGALKVEVFDGGDSHTVDNATLSVTGGGTEASAMRVTIANDSTGLVSVDDNGGSLTVDGGVTVEGDTAHDAADTGDPVKIGGRARTAHPTAVANNDRVDGYFDEMGRQVTKSLVPRDLVTANHVTLTTTTETTIIAAGGAGVFRDLVFLSLSNESASEVRVDIADSTAGADVMSIDLAADGGGAIIPFPVPFKQTTANNNWTATLSSAVSSVYITAIAVDDL